MDCDWERRTASPSLNRHVGLLNDGWAQCHVLCARDTSSCRLGATSDKTAQKWSPGDLAPGFHCPGWKRIRFSTSGTKRELAIKFREVKMIFSLNFYVSTFVRAYNQIDQRSYRPKLFAGPFTASLPGVLRAARAGAEELREDVNVIRVA